MIHRTNSPDRCNIGLSATVQAATLRSGEGVKAVAVYPRKPHSTHLVEVDRPAVAEAPSGRGVLVRLLQVGVDGTDFEINAGLYGDAPKGSDFLIVGHESFGQVMEIGPNVHSVRPGDYVVATVRRPGSSIYDAIGTYDMTTDTTYRERGISLLHGFLTEFFVDSCEFIVKVPEHLRDVGVLLEPFSIIQKAIAQACEIQRRLLVWQPRNAAVMGAGSIGLLATLALRLRGVNVTTFARSRRPTLHSELAEAIGATYESTQDVPVVEAKAKYGEFDLIFEATGSSPIAFESMQVLARNGVLILSSVTNGEQRIDIPSDKLNLEFVLGNKVMFGTVNANRLHFEAGIRDMALAETVYPGWLRRLMTDRVEGLDNYKDLFIDHSSRPNAIKAFCLIAS